MEGKKTVLDIPDIRRVIVPLCRQNGIRHVYLFGSYARGEANESSDIDLRVDQGNLQGLFAAAGFRLQLQEQLGKNVDLVFSEGISPEFHSRIQKDEVLLYEE